MTSARPSASHPSRQGPAGSGQREAVALSALTTATFKSRATQSSWNASSSTSNSAPAARACCAPAARSRSATTTPSGTSRRCTSGSAPPDPRNRTPGGPARPPPCLAIPAADGGPPRPPRPAVRDLGQRALRVGHAPAQSVLPGGHGEWGAVSDLDRRERLGETEAIPGPQPPGRGRSPADRDDQGGGVLGRREGAGLHALGGPARPVGRERDFGAVAQVPHQAEQTHIPAALGRPSDDAISPALRQLR